MVGACTFVVTVGIQYKWEGTLKIVKKISLIIHFLIILLLRFS